MTSDISPSHIVEKSWGREIIVVNSRQAGYCGKIMEAEPPGVSRIERHSMKDETFYVLEGVVTLELYGYRRLPEPECVVVLKPGDSYRLMPGHWHRFGAAQPGTRFVEFSTHHDDADTERATYPVDSPAGER